MKVHIVAAGRVRAGPEGMLVNSYLERFAKTGRSVGLGKATVFEYEAGPAGKPPASQIERAAKDNHAILCTLDEQGSLLTSRDFARQLAKWRDRGIRQTTFLIGGADGIDAATRNRADHCLSLGRIVLPHLLARVVLAEQLYRAVSILAGTSYHRD